MAKQNRTTLKGYFETGDTPSQAQYADLIDSKVNLSESNTGDITLVGNISASGTVFANALDLEGANITYNAANDLLKFGDSIKLGIGAGPVGATADLIISSDGANVNLSSATGDVTLSTAGGDTIIKNNTATGNILLQSDKNTNGNAGGSVIISGSNTDVRLDVRGSITASGNVSASNASTASFGSMILSNLPTTTPITTGSLWLSGSNAEGTSKHLMVFTG